MASYRILYWHQIPSVIEVRDNQGNRHKHQLSARFQELIDSVAMRKKIVGTDAYLEGWHRSRPKEREGQPADVAKAIAAEVESSFEEIVRSAREG